MENVKRVYCLYRVSTVGQVEKDDIPMQKQFCREFVNCHSGWHIENEFYEKGISGYKVSAKDRDAVEGQQRFDNHVDKLLNYIRYWQASGESIKTSVRVKTRMEQLTQDGLFTGGSIPYGYRLEKRGRINKRNREVCDLTVDDDAAKIVQLIFYKYVHEGYGAQRLCRYLTELGIRKADATSERIPELQIIDQDTFDAAQQLMAARATHHADTPLNMKGQSLLVGNIFCGHCGNRLTLTTSGRKAIQKDGTVRREIRCRYQCHYNLRHPGECDGQSGYGVTKLDGIVEKIIRHQFAQIKMASQNDVIAQQHEKAVELARQELESRTADMETEQQEYDKLKTWADLYDNCNFAAKKVIVSQFIKSVRVYRDYTLEVEFNVSFEQFQQLQAACSGGANERTNVCIEA